MWPFKKKPEVKTIRNKCGEPNTVYMCKLFEVAHQIKSGEINNSVEFFIRHYDTLRKHDLVMTVTEHFHSPSPYNILTDSQAKIVFGAQKLLDKNVSEPAISVMESMLKDVWSEQWQIIEKREHPISVYDTSKSDSVSIVDGFHRIGLRFNKVTNQSGFFRNVVTDKNEYAKAFTDVELLLFRQVMNEIVAEKRQHVKNEQTRGELTKIYCFGGRT